MAGKKRKRTVICLSSSSDDDEEEVENEGDDSDDEEDEEECSASTCSEGSDDEVMETDDDEEDLEDDDDDDNDDYICNRVIRLLQEGSDIKELKLKECKVYLRKHGLRITGTKEVCIERIKEHWRFDKVKRNGKLLGKRTIAGRIVKESYGAAKQQHTFTVEVLWSKGIKKLPPLFPLLVKGRNLYKLKTFRQRWKNEAERLQVLAEKHKRGAAARLVRSKKKAKKKLSSNGGEGYQKHFHHTKPAQVRRRTTSGKGKRVDECGRATATGHAKLNDHCQKALPIGQASIKSRAPESSQWHQRLSYPSKVTASNIQLHTDPAHNFYHSPMEFHHGNTPYRFSSHDMCSTPNMMRLPPFRPYADTFVMPPSWHQGVNKSNYNTHHAYSNPRNEFETRNLNRFPVHPFSLGTETYRGRKKGSHTGRR